MDELREAIAREIWACDQDSIDRPWRRLPTTAQETMCDIADRIITMLREKGLLNGK